MPANTQDTLYVNTGWEPSAVADYSLRITMTAEQEDATPTNNVLAKDVLYTDDIYGHDDTNGLDVELRPRESDDIAGFFDPPVRALSTLAPTQVLWLTALR